MSQSTTKFGGISGAAGGTLIREAGSNESKTVKELYGKVSTSKFAGVRFEPGDRILLTPPGGGGYGDPKDRAPESIEEDLREGYISKDSARRNYDYDPPNSS